MDADVQRTVELVAADYAAALARCPMVAKRDQHSEEHGSIRGQLVVRSQDVPLDCRYGVFATTATYDVVARFSPNSALPLPRDAQGLAIKVISPFYGMQPQDFLLANSETFFAKDAAACLALMQAKHDGTLWALARYFIGDLDAREWRLRELRNMIMALTHRVANPLAINYYSGTAIGCGPRAVKVSVKPWTVVPSESLRTVAAVKQAVTDPGVHEGLTGATGSTDPHTKLARAFAMQMRERGASFDMLLQHVPTWGLVNNPTVRCRTPWTPVAELHFPPQEPFDSEDLDFSVGNHVPDHPPRGEVAELRAAVYPVIAKARHGYNVDAGRLTQPPSVLSRDT